MAKSVDITRGPVRATGPIKQSLSLAVDVSNFDELDLSLVVFDGTSVTSKIITSMDADDDVVGWVSAESFATTSATGTSRINVVGILRYIRWEITSSGASTFLISGVGRSWT